MTEPHLFPACTMLFGGPASERVVGRGCGWCPLHTSRRRWRMIPTFQVLVGLALLVPLQSAPSGRKEPALTDYQKLRRGLATKTLRAGAPVGEMLDLCVPTWRRRLGRF